VKNKKEGQQNITQVLLAWLDAYELHLEKWASAKAWLHLVSNW
jgi:hypothetical protein